MSTKLTSNSLINAPGFLRWLLHGDGTGPKLDSQGSLVAKRLVVLAFQAGPDAQLGDLLAQANNLAVDVPQLRPVLFPRRSVVYLLAGTWPQLTVRGMEQVLKGKYHVEGESVVIHEEAS